MKSKLYVAKILKDLFNTNDKIMRFYVEHKDVMKLEDDLKEYLKLNYGLKNVYLHAYPVDKEKVGIVVCL